MVAIWMVYDLGEHANDFQEAHLGFEAISKFYLVQIPFIVVSWLPLCVLLGLLYVLTRMSRRNEIVKGKSKSARLDAHVFPNRKDHRIWFIQLLDAKNEQLRNVQVIQQDSNGVIQSKIYGQNATFDGSRKVWIFYNGKIAHMDPEGTVTNEEFFAQKEVSDW